MTAEVTRLVSWLQPKTVTPLTGGWTCETYSVDDAWIVQIARTNYAANTLRHQVRTLPKLASHLGPKIPSPQLVCDGPTTVVYRKLVGTRCDEAPDGAWPEQLGVMLSRLHTISPASLGLETLGPDTIREDRRADLKKLLAIVVPRLGDEDRVKAAVLVAGSVDDARNWRFTPTAIHADLGPEHVLVSPAGELAGVIDWEELHTGDPASDFGWWLHAMPAIGRRMLDAYGGAPDDSFYVRAKHAWAFGPWHEVDHGVTTNDPETIASGLEGVRARLT